MAFRVRSQLDCRTPGGHATGKESVVEVAVLADAFGHWYSPPIRSGDCHCRGTLEPERHQRALLRAQHVGLNAAEIGGSLSVEDWLNKCKYAKADPVNDRVVFLHTGSQSVTVERI